MTSINLADYANIKNNEVEKYCDNVTNASVKGDSVLYDKLKVGKFYVIKHKDVGSVNEDVYLHPHMGKLVAKIPSTPYFDIYTRRDIKVPGYIHQDNNYYVEERQPYNPSLYCFYDLDSKYTINGLVVPNRTSPDKKYIKFTIKPKETVLSDEKAGGKKRKTKKGKRGKKSKDSRKKSKSKRKNRK